MAKVTVNMAYHYSSKLKHTFADVMVRLTESLKKQGFGIITDIDMKETLKQKLNIDFRNYRIIGACNPEFAYQAISLESHIGLMLPCNIVIQEHENGEIEVSAINPMETMKDKDLPGPMTELVEEVSTRLRRVVDDLHTQPDGG